MFPIILNNFEYFYGDILPEEIKEKLINCYVLNTSAIFNINDITFAIEVNLNGTYYFPKFPLLYRDIYMMPDFTHKNILNY